MNKEVSPLNLVSGQPKKPTQTKITPSTSRAPMRLKLMELNTQDLFLRLAYPVSPSDLDGMTEEQWQMLGEGETPNKPLHQLKGLAQVFLDEAPDVALLCEVGGQETLDSFNQLFLGGVYHAFSAKGSERGIECAFLVKKSLPLRPEIHCHKNVPVYFLYPHEKNPASFPYQVRLAANIGIRPNQPRRLSRAPLELRLYPLDAGKGDAPGLIMLMMHLKSQGDFDGFDPRGLIRRGAEVKAVLKLKRKIEARYLDEVPVILAGDMNGRARRALTDYTFTPLYRQTELDDVLHLCEATSEERITHTTFKEGERKAEQLDYIFLPKALHAGLRLDETYVYRYRPTGSDLRETELPNSLRERAHLPSDHYPLVCVLDVGLGPLTEGLAKKLGWLTRLAKAFGLG